MDNIPNVLDLYSRAYVIYREITADKEHHTPQADVDTLVQRERDHVPWSIILKCSIMLVSRHRCPIIRIGPTYILHGTTLTELEEVQYGCQSCFLLNQLLTVMLRVRSSRHAHTLQHATYQCRTNYRVYGRTRTS